MGYLCFLGKNTKDLYSISDILYNTDSTQKWDILSVGKNRNIYIVQKPIYICGEQQIGRKKPHKKTQNCLISPSVKQKKIKHNKNKKETKREPENAKERIKTNNCEFCRRKILEYLKKAK